MRSLFYFLIGIGKNIVLITVMYILYVALTLSLSPIGRFDEELIIIINLSPV